MNPYTQTSSHTTGKKRKLTKKKQTKNQQPAQKTNTEKLRVSCLLAYAVFRDLRE